MLDLAWLKLSCSAWRILFDPSVRKWEINGESQLGIPEALDLSVQVGLELFYVG
jgi:hypothetical protein